MSKVNVREELENLVGLTQDKKESDVDYVKRIVGEVADVDNEEFEKLDKTTQKFVDEVIKDMNFNQEAKGEQKQKVVASFPINDIQKKNEAISEEKKTEKKVEKKKVEKKKVEKKKVEKKKVEKKKVEKKPEKKTEKKKDVSTRIKVGVISTIKNMVVEAGKGGVTKEAILKTLVKKFPDRDSDSMLKTINAQLGGKKIRMAIENKIGIINNDGRFSIK